MEQTSLSRSEIEALIVKQAWQDEAFRSEFLADPKATIEKYGEQKLPDEVKMFAHAEDESTVHFVIPQKPANADQLSDEDLEKVAGGVDVVTGLIIGGVALWAGAAAAAVGTKAGQGW